MRTCQNNERISQPGEQTLITLPLYIPIASITEVSKILGISTDNGKGYRALTNLDDHGGQEVPHLHFHLFGGEKIGKMVE